MMRFDKQATSQSNQRGWSLIEALAAVVVIGIGIGLFTKVQRMTSKDSETNSKLLLAGKLLEKNLEDTRILIAKDTVNNWPPRDTTIAPTPEVGITLRSAFSTAKSPKDGVVVDNVMMVVITASWTKPFADSLKVTTYVSKRF